jgi:hypothetical protein
MGRGRGRLVKALVVFGSVLAFLSVFAIWTERQALDTADWVHTSDRLIENETIRKAIANYLVEQLYDNVDVEQELKEILPGETKQFSGPLSGGLRQVAGDGAEKVLETSTAQSLWQEANRNAHTRLVEVLEEKGDAVSTEEGAVKLNLGSLLTDLADQVGVGADLAEKLPPDAAQIEILRSDQLRTAQNITTAIKGLALALSILTFAVFAVAIYFSRGSRWVTVLFCGIGLVAAGFAVIVARHIAGGIVFDQLVEDESIRPAAEAAWSISTSLMNSIATTVIVIGALFAVAGWLGSPTGSAVACRRAIAPALHKHIAFVYTGLTIFVCIYFLSSPTQGLRSFLTTLLVAGMAAFGIHELRKQTAAEFPDAEFSDAFGRTRDKVVGAIKDANIGERVGEQASKLRLPEGRKPNGDEAPTAAGDREEARLGRLERLASLRDKGVLTEDEFAAEKARVLGDGESA